MFIGYPEADKLVAISPEISRRSFRVLTVAGTSHTVVAAWHVVLLYLLVAVFEPFEVLNQFIRASNAKDTGVCCEQGYQCLATCLWILQ